MNPILEIENLTKHYESFTLDSVSFCVEPGKIMGFIGRNGAGKTTTLKSIMNLVHYDNGKVFVFGEDMNVSELKNKQRIGFALGELNYYPNKSVRKMVDVTKRFYKDFDDNKFKQICKVFNIDDKKKLQELSSGMKVKFSVAIALSHNAELLILDEPTSGLDPVSRDEVLDIFREIVKDGKRAILFSTHITSDLDKCASDITYINKGKIVFTGKKLDFVNSYYFVKDISKNEKLLDRYISYKQIDNRIEGLILKENAPIFKENKIDLIEPDLEQIMVYLERGKDNESFAL